MTRRAAAATCRRLALLLAFAAVVAIGAVLGATINALRWLLRPPLAALHSRLGRILGVLLLALLAASCHPPRTAAHLAGTFAGQDSHRPMPTGVSCRDSAVHSDPALGRRMECSAPTLARDVTAPIWRVMGLDGAILSVTRAAMRVPVWLPAGAARIELWMAAEGKWRLVYSYILEVP